MNLRPHLIEPTAAFGAEQEHAGERRETHAASRPAREEASRRVEDRRLAGRHDEPEGAGAARRIHQRQDLQAPRGLVRTRYPEGAERGKLLIITDAERESARGEAIDHALGDGAEVAGAKKHGHLVEVGCLVDRSMDAKTGLAKVLSASRCSSGNDRANSGSERDGRSAPHRCRPGRGGDRRDGRTAAGRAGPLPSRAPGLDRSARPDSRHSPRQPTKAVTRR